MMMDKMRECDVYENKEWQRGTQWCRYPKLQHLVPINVVQYWVVGKVVTYFFCFSLPTQYLGGNRRPWVNTSYWRKLLDYKAGQQLPEEGSQCLFF